MNNIQRAFKDKEQLGLRRGVVRGKGHGDNFPIKVTPGEAVLPVKTVASIGGPGAVRSLIKQTTGKSPHGLRPGGHYAVGSAGDVDPVASEGVLNKMAGLARGAYNGTTNGLSKMASSFHGWASGNSAGVQEAAPSAGSAGASQTTTPLQNVKGQYNPAVDYDAPPNQRGFQSARPAPTPASGASEIDPLNMRNAAPNPGAAELGEGMRKPPGWTPGGNSPNLGSVSGSPVGNDTATAAERLNGTVAGSGGMGGIRARINGGSFAGQYSPLTRRGFGNSAFGAIDTGIRVNRAVDDYKKGDYGMALAHGLQAPMAFAGPWGRALAAADDLSGVVSRALTNGQASYGLEDGLAHLYKGGHDLIFGDPEQSGIATPQAQEYMAAHPEKFQRAPTATTNTEPQSAAQQGPSQQAQEQPAPGQQGAAQQSPYPDMYNTDLPPPGYSGARGNGLRAAPLPPAPGANALTDPSVPVPRGTGVVMGPSGKAITIDSRGDGLRAQAQPQQPRSLMEQAANLIQHANTPDDLIAGRRMMNLALGDQGQRLGYRQGIYGVDKNYDASIYGHMLNQRMAMARMGYDAQGRNKEWNDKTIEQLYPIDSNEKDPDKSGFNNRAQFVNQLYDTVARMGVNPNLITPNTVQTYSKLYNLRGKALNDRDVFDKLRDTFGPVVGMQATGNSTDLNDWLPVGVRQGVMNNRVQTVGGMSVPVNRLTGKGFSTPTDRGEIGFINDAIAEHNQGLRRTQAGQAAGAIQASNAALARKNNALNSGE